MRRRRYSYGYGSYHGRSGFRTFLKVLIVILLVVLILAVAAVIFLEPYLVYDQNGAHLNLPFLSGQEEPSAAEPVQSPNGTLVMVSPTPTPAPDYLRAVSLPRTALTDGTAQSQVEAAGGNAVIFDMKADDGTLGYVSNLDTAKGIGSSASDPALNSAIQTLCAGELYTIARVSCFRDNTAPYQRNSLSIKTNSGYNWRDSGDIRWMSPTNADARAYVAGVCGELAALGFDEIVLDYSAYPVQGRLQNIRTGSEYDASQFTSVISGFYDQVHAALADYPQVRLSIITDSETVINGSNPSSGQTSQLLAQKADRIWLAPAEGSTWSQYTGPLSALGMDPNIQVVCVGTQSGTETQSWAILQAQ